MDPVDNLFNYKYGIFYFNKNDYRTVVPKQSRAMGWTLNFASWKTYIFLLFMLVIVVAFTLFLGLRN
ncbi:hypothetical protein GS399_18800 [Pedobacter sp. HMF7647]|uniref:DUF5808 domain-containing protein n=1 Tax=Hufsiella arboris TaxID=2695275 RepID=A0A7K1YEI7_9SPHI|nr:hypothetical protein [Hufsiella arboris]